MNEKCEIVRDLMPLCIDGTASETARTCVQTHIADCEACRNIYQEMVSSVEMSLPPAKDRPEFVKAVKVIKGRRQRRAWLMMLRGVLLALLLGALGFAGYVWYCGTPVPVRPSKLSFHQTSPAEGLVLLYASGIPEGAQMHLTVVPTDRDGDGECRYEAYLSFQASRHQLHQRGEGAAYYVLGSAKDSQLYMTRNGVPVMISQIVQGTAETGGKVIYLASTDLPQVALFGLNVKSPDRIVWSEQNIIPVTSQTPVTE